MPTDDLDFGVLLALSYGAFVAEMLLVVLLIKPLKVRVIAAIGLSVLSVGLSFHYAGIVHGPTWIGNPESFTLDSVRPEHEWHTPLTGLYRRQPE